MKVTNVSPNTIYLGDLKLNRQSQTEGREGEDRYLGPGRSVYLPNTSEVLRSAFKGALRAWRDAGVVELEEEITLDAVGGPSDTAVLTHDYGYPPVVYILKKVGFSWVDATGTVDIFHNLTFTQTSITNTVAAPITFLIRLV